MSHVIKCEGDDNAVLFRKMPLDDYSQDTAIIVPDTLNAIIVKDGIALETLSSGKHKIFSKKSNFFKEALTKETQIDLIYVSKTAKLNLLWGTEHQYDMRDPITGVPIKLGASGEMELQISNPRKAYLELIGQSKEFNMDILKERLQ